MANQKERRTRRKKKPTAVQQALIDAEARRKAEAKKEPENTLQTLTPLSAARPVPGGQKAQGGAEKMVPSAGNRNPQVPIAGLNLEKTADEIGARAQALAAEKKRNALADPGLFGSGVASSNLKARLDAQRAAINNARRGALAKQGNAVYMGPIQTKPNARRFEGDFEGGQSATPGSLTVDKVVDKNQLMAWLSDATIFGQLKRRMEKAGIDVSTYDDVAKLWKSVVDQAAATYSVTGKKVTPWALLELRGKQMVGGKPAPRTTTSTTIDEMDPSEARMMFEDAAQKYLGRRASNAEIDDFIAKAQTIARNHPDVTKTTTEYGFDGQPISQTSHSSGGADAVNAAAQSAAEDMAMQQEDYGSTQAAGFYFPILTDALGPAVG